MADQLEDQFLSGEIRIIRRIPMKKGPSSSRVVYPLVDISGVDDSNSNDPDSQFVKNLQANILKESRLIEEREEESAKKSGKVGLWGFEEENANEDWEEDEKLKPLDWPPEYPDEITEIEAQKKIISKPPKPGTPARPRALPPISEWGNLNEKISYTDPDEENGVTYISETKTLGPSRGGTAGSTTSASRRVKSPNPKKNIPVSANSIKSTVPPPDTSVVKKFAQAARTIMDKLNSAPNQEKKSASGFRLGTPILTHTTTQNKKEIVLGAPLGKPKVKVAAGPRLYSYGPDYYQVECANFQNSKVRLPFGNYFQSKLFVDIIVTEVQSPDLFYIRNNETTGELEYMEECMNEFYVPHWNENANIDPRDIFVGCFYSVYVEEKNWWYRGRVDSFYKERNKPMQVLVQLMDYGEMAILDLDCLLPLRKIYYQLPFQAAIGTLQTVDDSLPFKLEEIRQFQADVDGKRFQAFITEHKWGLAKQDFPYVTLVLLETVDGVERPYSLGSRTDISIPANLP